MSVRFARSAVGKDVADHLAAEKGLDELLPVEVVVSDDLYVTCSPATPKPRRAPAIITSTAPPELVPRPHSFSGLEIAGMTFPDPDPVVLYAERGCTFDIAAASKVGKTSLVMLGCKALLQGEPFLDLPTKCVPVLYLTEQTRRSFRDKLESVGFLLGCQDFHVLFIADFGGLPWDEVCAVVRDEVNRHSVGLVVIDTLTDWARMQDENDAAEALMVMRPLRLIAEDGAAVITLRHTGKGDHSNQDVVDVGRGSSAFAGVVDTLCALGRVPGAGHPNQRQLRFQSRRDGIPATLVIELEDGRYSALGSAANVEYRLARAFVRENLPDSEATAITEKDVLEASDKRFSRSTLKRVLNDLTSEGVVAGKKGAGRASSKAFGYWLRDAEDQLSTL